MNNNVKLSFCPTMTPFATQFDKNVEEVTPMPAQSAAQVMSMLGSNMIDIALIGRAAYSRELTEQTKTKRLQSGYTLVYTEKAGIPKEQLNTIPIKTYLSEEIAKQILPTLKNVKFYSSLNECEKNDIGMPMLIDWADFKDEYELLIPVEPTGGKVPTFRAPVLYYNDKIPETIIEKIVDSMNKYEA